MRLDACRNIADLRHLARRRLPAPMFHFIDGGADDEVTLRRNTTAFDDYELVPDTLVDVGAIDTRTSLLGATVALPLMLSPTGSSRLFHHHKELGIARAAGGAGIVYALSCMSNTTLEEVARQSDAPKVFQIYLFRDRGLTTEFVERCRAAGYHAICVTVDVPLGGNRERDLLTGMTVPPSFGPRSAAGFALRPRWLWHYLRDPRLTLANVAHRVGGPKADGPGFVAYVNSQFDRRATWKDAAWLAGLWGGPFMVKGLLSPDDARKAVDAGASAIMVSNHGGRQLDRVPAPIDCVASMRDAVGGGVQLIVDGGVRRGTHVLEALAAGADACSIGRPYLYGLAAGGQAGVERALTILRTELERDMALLGCRNVGEISARHLRRRGDACRPVHSLG